MIGELASIVAPVYAIAGLGYGWARANRHFDGAFATDLVMTVGAPCLVFSTLSTLELERSALLEMVAATVVVLAATFAVAAVALRVAGAPLPTFLGTLVFGNAGNMGLPLCYFAFGADGLAFGACFFAVAATAHYTVGQWVWSGRASLREIHTPLTWAVVAAVAVLATGASVPVWVARTTETLGGLAIPLMQLSLGMSLAQLRLTDVPRTLGLALARLAIGLGVGVVVASAFGLEGTARGVLILDSAMPAAVFNYMMAARYGRAPSDVASVVVLSTLVAFGTLPLVIGWLLSSS